MKRLPLQFVLLMALVGPFSAVAEVHAQAEELDVDARARGEELFLNGRSLYDEGNYSEAIDVWRLGYELTDAPLFLFNIAAAQERNGDYEGAMESLVEYRAVAPAEERMTLSRRINNLRERVESTREPVVRVPEPAQDTAARGEASPVGAPPAGYTVQPPSAQIGDDEAEHPVATDDARPKMFGAGEWTVLSLAATALAGGVALAIRSDTLRGEAERHCDDGLCLEEARLDLERGRRMAVGADAMFGVAAVGAVSVVVSALIRHDRRNASEHRLNGGVAPRRDGFVVTVGGLF